MQGLRVFLFFQTKTQTERPKTRRKCAKILSRSRRASHSELSVSVSASLHRENAVEGSKQSLKSNDLFVPRTSGLRPLLTSGKQALGDVPFWSVSSQIFGEIRTLTDWVSCGRRWAMLSQTILAQFLVFLYAQFYLRPYSHFLLISPKNLPRTWFFPRARRCLGLLKKTAKKKTGQMKY